jgi:hypothetical protein
MAEGSTMKRLAFAACVMLLATPALADPSPPPPQPGQPPQPPVEMVMLPRPVAEQALQWLAAPNPNNAVMLYATFSACLNDNPKGGVAMRMGQDQCPTVSDALAARDKEIADLKKQIADLKPAPVASAEPGK